MANSSNSKRITKTYSYLDSSIPCDLSNFEPSIVDQSILEESDINYIVDNARRGAGLAPQPQLVYADLTQVSDLADAYEQIRIAEANFMSLDAKQRSRFNNDPVQFVQELPSLSQDELKALGFVDLPTKPSDPLDAQDGPPAAPANEPDNS